MCIKTELLGKFQVFFLGVIKKTIYFCSIMAVSKTRTKLVEVARMLFAKKGLDATTMNDIAVASKKGRRTLYTYFENKEDVYYAVIEAEMERLSDKMSEVAHQDIAPMEKLLELIFTHLKLIKEAVFRNGNLRAEFFRNIWMVEKVRKKLDQAEINFLKETLEDGSRKGVFDIENLDLVADVVHYSIKGLEVPYIYGRLGNGINPERNREIVEKLIIKAVSRHIE